MPATLKNQHLMLAQRAYDAICHAMTKQQDQAKASSSNEEAAKVQKDFSALLENNISLNPWEQAKALKAFANEGKLQQKRVENYLMFCKEYRSHIRKFPALIRTNTLVSALSFAKQKQKKDNAWACIHKQMEEYIKDFALSWLDADQEEWRDAMYFILHCDVQTYKMLQRECLRFVHQLASYAVGIMPEKPDDKQPSQDQKAIEKEQDN